MNSNNLFTTVFKNFQWALKNLGYCPTTYLPRKPAITNLKQATTNTKNIEHIPYNQFVLGSPNYRSRHTMPLYSETALLP